MTFCNIVKGFNTNIHLDIKLDESESQINLDIQENLPQFIFEADLLKKLNKDNEKSYF
jgi:hypothetical protein